MNNKIDSNLSPMKFIGKHPIYGMKYYRISDANEMRARHEYAHHLIGGNRQSTTVEKH